MRFFHTAGRRRNIPLLFLFLAGFVAGVFLMNVGKKTLLENTGFLDEYSLYQMKYMSVESNVFFVYVLRKRLGTMGVILLLASTYLGLAVLYAYSMWLGASLGMLLTASIIRYGLKGIFLLLTAAFPHYILYVPVWIMMFCSARELYASGGISGRGGGGRDKGQEIRRRAVVFLTMAGIVTVGAWLESYINPGLVTGLLKIF
ncbi:MAG: stage II sporulation protein M [Lachnospiraceae bacterium]|nr:stage II sporulation protein M [Lachnospiraceae bacterium]